MSYKSIAREKQLEITDQILVPRSVPYSHDDPPSKLPDCIAPPRLTLPPTFLDISWLHFHSIQFPCSESYFLETIIPQLKESFSLSLEHCLPLAGNLAYPLNTELERPMIRYVTGDFVSLTIFESTFDFGKLIRNHA
ncbi:Anthocyanin 5-O-glucoside 6'''-O-malonyltransferase [Handroanthus impetiginosus]|uniref:Anthocyanin 5-O-glucoside 6'''-O-malonyltransferase n=1 Tax=Handroanthus impetiginosus TaxID=429701 RepID=A0A2G9HMU9_9LAMI|nr:Anthocyanin 5-O-glucoside 6'''-O-malonyltransferase [Handroanthus impetiginosus]